MTSASTFWLHFRVVMLAVHTLTAWLCYDIMWIPMEQDLPKMFWPVLLSVFGFGVLLMPVLVVALVEIQASNPLSAEVWRVPSHDMNPFSLRTPLPFIHFAAYLAIGIGIGATIRGLFMSWPALMLALMQVATGAAILIGLKWSLRRYRHKIVPPWEEREQVP